LRLYSIDDDGLRVGHTLPDPQGLLGGRPTRSPGVGSNGPLGAAAE
jgi:circadian clock protein KaiC